MLQRNVSVLQAEITTGYQEKPCLNPRDPECPTTAPNRLSNQALDIGAQLTGGCNGFATKYMQWPEELLVGGAQKNRTGHVVRAEALQTLVQLMGEQNVFHYYKNNYKVHHIEWTVQKAKAILEAWQDKFTQVNVTLTYVTVVLLLENSSNKRTTNLPVLRCSE